MTLYKSFFGSIILILAVVLCWTPASHAEKKTFEKEYTYRASDVDSKVTSRLIALEQVKRMLLEELGTYLIARTEVKDYQLSKDKVSVLTAGMVQTEIVAEKWDGLSYYVKARITADPQEVARGLRQARAGDQKSSELEETNRKVDEALLRIKQLQDSVAAGKQTAGMQSEYQKAVDQLTWKELIDKGVAHMNAEQYRDGLNAFLKAIDINPGHSWAYIDAGWALNSLGDYQQALQVLNKAETLDPRNPWIYVNRAGTYNFLGNFSQALSDAEKALGIDATIFWAYFERGWAQLGLGNFERALQDMNRCGQMEPNNGAVYRMRAWAHAGRGDKRLALADLDRSVELEPKSQWTYWNRAAFFSLGGDKPHALEDLAKAVRINGSLKIRARTDRNFQPLWTDGDFKKLTEGE